MAAGRPAGFPLPSEPRRQSSSRSLSNYIIPCEIKLFIHCISCRRHRRSILKLVAVRKRMWTAGMSGLGLAQVGRQPVGIIAI